MKKSKKIKRKKRIAIIGGGAGGLYTAMRIAESDDFKKDLLKVDIYEATDRMGGRVFTLPIDNFPFTADIGAMRYIGNRQLIISSLVKHLELKSETHKVETLSIFSRDKFFIPHASEIMEKSNLIEAAKPQQTYNVKKEERYIPPALMVIYAIAKALSGLHINDAVDQQDMNRRRVEVKIAKLKRVFETRDDDDKTYIKNICDYLIQNLTLEFFSLEEWDLIRNNGMYNNDYLYQTCLFEILHKELSFEAVLLAQESLGYSSIFGSANAAEHIPWFLADFSSTTYSAIAGGMSKLIFELEERCKASGIRIMKGCKLLSVDRFKKYKLKFDHNPREINRRYDKVIFSISKCALERIHFDSRFKLKPELEKICKSKKISDAIQCVSSLPLMKAFLFFDSDWFWKSLNTEKKKLLLATNSLAEKFDKEWMGQSIDAFKILTDLPIKQIYFHELREGKIWTSGRFIPDEEKRYVKSMIMAYGDSKYSELWSSLSRVVIKTENQKRPVIDEKFAKEYLTPNHLVWEYEASQALKEVLMRNIREVLRKTVDSNTLADIEPVAVFMQDWNHSPYFGGWHVWSVNCKPWEIRQVINQPYEQEQIYICGEVFSTDQGWIEGAFRTAENMLNQHFGCKQPEWVDYSLVKKTIWSIDNERISWENYLNW